MADIIEIVKGSCRLYVEHWREVVTAFAALFAVAVAFELLQLVPVLGFFAAIAAIPGMEAALAVVLIAVFRPLGEIADGKPPSDWTTHVGPTLVPALKAFALRFAVNLAMLVPFIILAAVLLGPAIAAVAQDPTALPGVAPALTAALPPILLCALATLAVFIAVTLLLMFLEIEVSLGNMGVLDAAKASCRLVLSNLAAVIVFEAVWLGIAVVIMIPTALLTLPVSLCFPPLASLITNAVMYLGLFPVMYLSLVKLWKEIAAPK